MVGSVLIGVANKMQYLRRSWTLPNDLKHNEASFSTISTDVLYLRVTQTPRSPDLAIFVLTTDDRQTTDGRQTTDKTDYFTPCACARGNYYHIPSSFIAIVRNRQNVML